MDDFNSITVQYCRSRGEYVTNVELVQKCKEYRKLFEAMLITESWINQESHSKSQVRDLAPARLAKFMTLYKTTINRTDGCGLKIPKFHQLKHLPRYMLKFGVPNNFSTSRCESHHITLSKRPAQTAQKRDECFEQQVGERIIDSIVLSKATSAILASARNAAPIPEKHVAGTKFSIIKLQKLSSYVAVQCNNQGTILPYPTELLDAFAPEFSDYYPLNDGVPCFTEHQRLDQHGVSHIFRGHPNYRGKAWHDWALFRWASGDESDEDDISINSMTEIPGRILFYFDATKLVDHPKYDPALYAVIESLDRSTMSLAGSKIIRRSTLSKPGDYLLVNTDAIVDTAFVIPNLGKAYEYYVVAPPKEWGSFFIR